ncbi:restriction endonuclease subunit S [Globicatella sulfidifaciens]|uniref:Type I restriction modification DNA specificity domain-containing protein n=1 Tax=Globicatella sulfidifaciens TaxID=136093 RepID=A0A7X8H0B6_9LACT|nr:restriction endonuclease subunit S [Globicatella sulfidifaciens]NLJ18432.1 hypothetical protein [Globicatella sulfidifaciens]
MIVYTNSGIEWLGHYPKDWEILKLKYLCNIDTGSKDTQDKIDDGLYPFFVRSPHIERLNEYTHDEEAVMTAGDGVGVGKVFHYYKGKFAAHQRVYVFTRFRKVLGRYIYYYLTSNLAFEVLSGNAKSTVDSLRRPMLAEFPVVVPSIKTQKKIVRFLDLKIREIDNLIQSKSNVIALLEEKRQSIITEAVTKGLDPDVKMKDSVVEWIGNVPEHWEVSKIKRIAEIRPSNVDKKSVEGETEVYLCNYVDVYYNNEITSDLNFMRATAKKEQIDKFTLKKHDVIITKDSESPTDIAIPTWVAEDLMGVICGYHLSLIRPNNYFYGQYLYFCLESEQIREQFYSLANGVTRYGLSKDAIKNGLVPHPPLNEQIEIANKLYNITSDIEIIIKQIKDQIEKLEEYRQSLIYEAVTGKIDVSEMNLD